MEELNKVIDEQKFGIFESPTGTGKTMSIICGALSWLLKNSDGKKDGKHETSEKKEENTETQNKNKRKRETEEKADSDDEPAWLKRVSKQIEEEAAAVTAKKEQDSQDRRIKRVRKYNDTRKRVIGILPAESTTTAPVNNDDEFLLKDYESEDNEDKKTSLSKVGIGALVADLYASSDDESSRRDDDENEDTFYTPKIIYCSRTHSQLSQFIGELKKTEYAPLIRVTSLASRMNLCVNSKVNKLKSATRVNEVCLDMKNKSIKEKMPKCEYYDISAQKLYKDHVLIKVREIEELVTLGKRIVACPYYGTRRAVPHAQVVVLPYSSLIHKPTRESLGIKSLKDCIVIIDEAHNIVDAVVSAYSTTLTGAQLLQAHAQLTRYFAKYQLRLKPKNQSRVKQVLNIMNSFIKYLKLVPTTMNEKSQNKSNDNVSSLATINDFIFSTNVDNINLFDITEFMEKAELAKKLNGFIEKVTADENAVSVSGSASSATAEESTSVESGIHAFIAFLEALMNANKDGKLLVSKNANMNKSLIKFLLLNPGVYFKDIVEEAKSVILAGGTMEPISSIVQQLIPSEKSNQKQLHIFKCGHVIPPENLAALCVAKGPTGIEFDFTFQNRSSTAMIEELGRMVLNVCTIVPDGVILFFASYSYEEQVHQVWQKSGITQKIEQKKKLFREPKLASQVESVLSDYKAVIDNNFPSEDKAQERPFKGALLSSVVGGKMSEGINFSDGYGRCVIVVGLPYPNSQDVELKEKLAYMESHVSKAASSEYYLNMCMKAVNQSIGRSIRHKDDYATILLVDKRYNEGAQVRAKLPQWIQSQVSCVDKFGPCVQKLGEFFKKKAPTQEKFYNERKSKTKK